LGLFANMIDETDEMRYNDENNFWCNRRKK